jgi:WD40 repeat protein
MFSRHSIAIAALTLAAVVSARPAAAQYLSKLFAPKVVNKIAELPETDKDLIVLGVDFSPDGSRIVVQSDEEKINIWDWRNQRIEKTIEKPRGASNLRVTNPLRYSPNGRFLASCFTGAVGGVAGRIWSTTTWAITKDIADETSCVEMRFTPDGKSLLRLAAAKANVNNFVSLSTDSWQPQWGLRLPLSEPFSLAVSPDGSLVAAGGRKNVWPVGVDDPIKRVQQSNFEPFIHIVNLQVRKVISVTKSAAMGPMAWSPDGTRLAVAGELYLDIFDVQSGECLVHEMVEKSGDMNVRYTPDGRYLIQSDLNGRGAGLGVKIWASQSHKLLQEIPGDIGSIAVSRDSKYLAVGATGRTTIWQFK